ncbi:MAG TPA: DNA polymerase III subunit delta [Candidatus Cloacimonetes bacterium]|nr:DNA polymerase III subunit delta [Candidatus Cloacimonadota bacterium]HEX37293.1 DNA polymerase III subunit delta [Candidatus Cloacimonadota bacterium]
MNKKRKFWDLQEEIQRGTIHNNYFFTDEESYLKDKAFSLIKQALVPDNLVDFNYEIFFGEETRANQIIEALQSPPMMTDKKLVVLRNFQLMHIAHKNKILAYLQKPIPDAVLIIETDKVKVYSGMYAKLTKTIPTYFFYHPYNETEAIRFLREEARALQKSIDNDAAHIMVDYIGLNYLELHSELEKVALFVGTQQAITTDDVKESIGISKGNTIYELQNALAQRNCRQSIKVLENLLANNVAPVLIIIMLARFYATLWDILIQRFQQNRSKTEIERSLGGYGSQQLMRAVDFYKLEQFEIIFATLLDTDKKLKSLDPKLNKTIMQLMVYNLCKNV